ncbi:MAG: electron transport complex subunit RsxB [Candidatus Methylopumilus sp.]|nr:electron transport complex subunit RsxB [Candidatus Methylopumilus sp.]
MLAQRINALLPQTQCTKCGYQGCAPYAEAIASEGAAINRCPPGGGDGIAALAQLLKQPLVELDASCGSHQPLQVAVIDEQFCIGCTLCIQACPVDAIIGASKLMHTVLPAQCTGCDLCVAPCPVDCISMVPVTPARTWTPQDATRARTYFEARQRRLAQGPESLRQSPEFGDTDVSATTSGTTQDSAASAQANKQAAIANALARARARRTTPAYEPR